MEQRPRTLCIPTAAHGLQAWGQGPQAELTASRPLLQGTSLCPSTQVGTGHLQGGPEEGIPAPWHWLLHPWFPALTAGRAPLCCSRRGACLSAFLLLLLATLAALTALGAIFGTPPRTPGQGGQERVGPTCWEGMGCRDMGEP